jgi:hypothetical protein
MRARCWSGTVLLLGSLGCSNTGDGGGTIGAGGSTMGGGEAHQHCVDRINEFRATEGKPAYARWADQEACASDEARQDAISGESHGAFPQCGELAQNECPGYDSIEEALGSCLDRMWAEGPGTDFDAHGHYLNMSSTKYTEVACGFYTTSSGEVWVVQDYR